ncbi:MAG: hypothetical protein ACOCQ5_02355 [Halanaerobiales bacterium]
MFKEKKIDDFVKKIIKVKRKKMIFRYLGQGLAVSIFAVIILYLIQYLLKIYINPNFFLSLMLLPIIGLLLGIFKPVSRKDLIIQLDKKGKFEEKLITLYEYQEQKKENPYLELIKEEVLHKINNIKEDKLYTSIEYSSGINVLVFLGIIVFLFIVIINYSWSDWSEITPGGQGDTEVQPPRTDSLPGRELEDESEPETSGMTGDEEETAEEETESEESTAVGSTEEISESDTELKEQDISEMVTGDKEELQQREEGLNQNDGNRNGEEEGTTGDGSEMSDREAGEIVQKESEVSEMQSGAGEKENESEAVEEEGQELESSVTQEEKTEGQNKDNVPEDNDEMESSDEDQSLNEEEESTGNEEEESTEKEDTVSEEEEEQENDDTEGREIPAEEAESSEETEEDESISEPEDRQDGSSEGQDLNENNVPEQEESSQDDTSDSGSGGAGTETGTEMGEDNINEEEIEDEESSYFKAEIDSEAEHDTFISDILEQLSQTESNEVSDDISQERLLEYRKQILHEIDQNSDIPSLYKERVKRYFQQLISE